MRWLRLAVIPAAIVGLALARISGYINDAIRTAWEQP